MRPTARGGTSWSIAASPRCTSPTQVPGTGWTSLSDGEDHACGTQTGATAACWGNGSSGQLGSILLWVPVAVIDPAP